MGLLAALVGIPAIEAFRNVGFANRDSVNWTDVTPVDTLTELGGSLQATMAYVDWIEKGDPYLLGGTLLGTLRSPDPDPRDPWP